MTKRFLYRHAGVSAVFILFGLVALCARAFAQAPSTTVDLSPLMAEVVWPALGALAVALAGWVAQRAATWFHLQNQDVVRGYVLKALQTGLDVAYARLGGAPLSIETRNQTVASIANYLITSVPQGLKALGFTLKADDPKLLALVGAHLEAQQVVPSVVTPEAGGIVAAARATRDALVDALGDRGAGPPGPLRK